MVNNIMDSLEPFRKGAPGGCAHFQRGPRRTQPEVVSGQSRHSLNVSTETRVWEPGKMSSVDPAHLLICG